MGAVVLFILSGQSPLEDDARAFSVSRLREVPVMHRSQSTFTWVYAVMLCMLVAPAFADDGKGINLWQPGDPGKPLHISGRVHDATGKPIPGAIVRIRQADGNGQYHPDRYRAEMETNENGAYGFATVLPGQYSAGKHIHVSVSHDRFNGVDTEILFKTDPETLEEGNPSGIHLEKAQVEGKDVLFGRFDIEMR